MKKFLSLGIASIVLLFAGQKCQASGQDIKDGSGSMFMEETTPAPSTPPPKNITIDLTNVGVPVDPKGRIVPIIDRDAPGGVRQNFSNLEVYSEPPINFIPYSALTPPMMPLVPPPYSNIGLNLGKNFRLNLATPNPYGYSPYGFSPYGGYGGAPTVGAAPFGIPGAPFGGATAPFSYGVPPFGGAGYGAGGFGNPGYGGYGYPGLGYRGYGYPAFGVTAFGYPGLGAPGLLYPGSGYGAGPFSYPGLGFGSGLGLGLGLGLGGPLVYSSPFGYGSPLGGSTVFSTQTRGLGLNLSLPNNVEWQSSSTFKPLVPDLDGPPEPKQNEQN